MKRFAQFLFVAGAIALTASCAKEINVDNVVENNGKEIQITVIASEKPVVNSETKTYIDGTSVKWSSTGEKIKVFEVATPVDTEAAVETAQAVSAEGSTSDSGATMTFGVSLTAKENVSNYSSFDYYAVYPSSAYQTGNTISSIALNTKAAQTPSATNFDPSQDLLIAKKVENGGSQATTLNMEFARLVAVGKMTIKNLGTTDEITKIRFSAKEGTGSSATPIVLAGRTAFNLETARPVTDFGSNSADHEIILDYEGQGITADSSTGMVAYFLCYPFTINSANPGSFKVIVETATQTFTKEVNVSSAKGLSFVTGKSSVFSVSMSGIVGETKEVDLRYAYLDYGDFTTAGGTSSYSNVTANKAHGDSWVMYAVGTNNAIGVRRNDDGSNDSYIKLPDFKENINTVVVTLKNVTASKTITLESSATASNGSVASLTTSTATVYTFDLSSASVKTAYFRSNGAQAQVEKIEVYAGVDNRTAFAAPATVSAELNTDDSDVTNSIDVSWSSVDNASGYVITLIPDSGDDVVVKAATSPYTVTNLTHEMDYLVSVQAEPADYYVNSISAATTANDVVTTGAAPAGVVTLTDTDITAGSNAAKITVNSLLGYRLGTSKNAGVLTIDANNYATISFKAVAWKGSTDSFSITNGTVSGASSVSPSANDAATGTINTNATVSIVSPYSEITIDVTDPSAAVVITSNKRVILWGFEAEEYVVDTRSDAPISWGRSTAAANMNGTVFTWTDPNGSQPVLTNNESLSVTYSSSVESVATINATSGVVSLAGAGTTVITATYAGDAGDTYKHTEVSYSLTVTDVTTYSITVTQPTGAVSGFSISASPSGSQTAGTSITLSYSGTVSGYHFTSWDVYETGNSTNKVTVTSNSFTMPAFNVTVTGVFSEDAGSADATFNYQSIYGSSGSGSINLDGESDTVDGVIIEYARVSGSNAPQYYYNGYNLRIYNSSTMTFTAPSGKKITAIDFSQGTVTWASGKMSGDSGSVNDSTKKWTNSTGASKVVITITGSFKFTDIVVTYE